MRKNLGDMVDEIQLVERMKIKAGVKYSKINDLTNNLIYEYFDLERRGYLVPKKVLKWARERL